MRVNRGDVILTNSYPPCVRATKGFDLAKKWEGWKKARMDIFDKNGRVKPGVSPEAHMAQFIDHLGGLVEEPQTNYGMFEIAGGELSLTPIEEVLERLEEIDDR